MADNFNFSQGTGTAGAADDIDGVLYPRVKVVIGANNTNDGDISSANPLPITGSVTADLGANNDVTVTGTVDLGATDNAVLDTIATNTGATLTDTELRATPVPVSGTVTANLSATDNTVLDNIDADLTTVIGHVDGVETLLGTIDADTSTLAGAVAGTEVQVDVVSSALPTGASTAAKQPALGTAGTASADVITVQGIASMTPLTVDLGANNDVTLAVLPDTATGDLAAIQEGVSSIQSEITTNLGAIESSTGSIDTKTPALGQAAMAASVPVVLASNQSSIPVAATLGAETTKVIGTVNVAAAQTIAVTNAGTFATQATLQAGSAAIGKLAANSGVDIGDVDVASIAAGDNNIGNVDIASAIPAGTNTIGKVAPNEYELAGNTTHVKKYYTNAGAATDGIIWSPAAGKRWYVTDIFIQVSAAATVTLEDDLTAGDSAVWKAELAANSGWSHSFTTPLFSGEDAADLLITTTAGNVYVTCTGYEI